MEMFQFKLKDRFETYSTSPRQLTIFAKRFAEMPTDGQAAAAARRDPSTLARRPYSVPKRLLF